MQRWSSNRYNMPNNDSYSLRKIRWQCRRGLLELDELLTRFLDTQYQQLSDTKKTTFVALLTHTDQELLDWLTEQAVPPDSLVEIIQAILLSP